jgi:hypothetical protein
MKKLLLVLIVACIAGASLFAWSPEDLTKFPSCMDAKSWILNVGLGLPNVTKHGDDFISIPPIHLSFDKNIELGDNKLPFFVGGILGYSGWGYTNRVNNGTYWRPNWVEKKYFYHFLSVGGRFGYHFNWNVNNLDTYAVTTAGWIIYAGDQGGIGVPLLGANVGARYFISKGFGFWVELGYTTFSSLDVGLAFKF